MSDRSERIAVSGRIRLDISTSSGDITVVPGEPDRVDVELSGVTEHYTVELVGDTVVVHPDKSRSRRFRSTTVLVRAPEGTTVVARCSSGDISVTVPATDVDLSVASGDIRVLSVGGDAKVRAASGDVTIDEVARRAVVTTASGSVRVGTIGTEAAITTASGDAVVDLLEGTAKFQTASGDITIRRVTGGNVTAKTLSGDVKLGIPNRRRIDYDIQSLSGEFRADLPPGDGSPPQKHLTLKVKSVSGDVVLVAG